MQNTNEMDRFTFPDFSVINNMWKFSYDLKADSDHNNRFNYEILNNV